MINKRLKEAERLLAAYAARYGLTDAARVYFAKWGNVQEPPCLGKEQTIEREGSIDSEQ